MRLVKFVGWLMILGGILLGAICLFLIAFPPHDRPGSVTKPADNRYFLLLAAYMATVVAVLGAGLSTRLEWAWCGTLTICLIFAFVGLAFPFIATSAKSVSVASVVGAAFVGEVIFTPSLLFFIHLLRKPIRDSFEAGEMSLLWVRVLAVNYFIGVGIEICESFSPHKRALFGLIQNPIILTTEALLMAALWFFIAKGLYKFNEIARRWAISASLYSVIQYACFVFLDHASKGKPAIRLFTLGVSTVFYALTIWYLHTRRATFSRA